MLNSISITGVGGVFTLVELFLRVFGIELPEGSVLAAVNGLITVVGVILLIWGQVRRPDLKWGFLRK